MWVSNTASGSCIFASLEMWMRYLEKTGWEISYDPELSDTASGSARDALERAYEGGGGKRIFESPEQGGVNSWIGAIISDVRMASGLPRYVEGKIYDNLSGSNSLIPSSRDRRQPSIAFVKGDNPSAISGLLLDHAVLVVGMKMSTADNPIPISVEIVNPNVQASDSVNWDGMVDPETIGPWKAEVKKEPYGYLYSHYVAGKVWRKWTEVVFDVGNVKNGMQVAAIMGLGSDVDKTLRVPSVELSTDNLWPLLRD